MVARHGTRSALYSLQLNASHAMKLKHNRNTAGFTLVEIMIVVAIIALLAAIAVPNFLRSRKRSLATQILSDLRQIDSAMDQYALETNKADGTPVSWADIQRYVKNGSRLYDSNSLDVLGNSFNITSVGVTPKVNNTSYDSLSDIAPADFWSPFR